ncbi:hypothetical protein HMPREF9946_03395 [Acetobacteraceae bacterium AT-5844]|nr:hypothetical protein HMPREF9946_03395 [Acetobacteraceae bacterium AT-5844]
MPDPAPGTQSIIHAIRYSGMPVETSPTSFAAAALALLATLALAPADAAAQPTPGQREIGRVLGPGIRQTVNGVLGLLSYSAVPDNSASAVQIDRGVGTDENDSGITMGQLGAGFTVSESFPLYLEGFLGYARYDPVFVFSDGAAQRRLPTRWNSVSGTVGIGYDIRLAENLYLRPILNGTIGYVGSDAALAGAYLDYRFDRQVEFLTRGQVTSYGVGGALMLAYYDHLPAREIDIELRATHMHLEAFHSTGGVADGQADSTTVNLWARYRWPTGMEIFQRPVRWVTEATGSYFMGDQKKALGLAWLGKVGGGIELDFSAHEIGAFGLNLQRLRLVGRYVFGEDVQGFSIGLGMSF